MPNVERAPLATKNANGEAWSLVAKVGLSRLKCSVWLGSVLAVLSACDEPATLTGGEEVSEEAGALATPSWFAPECADTGLESPAGACDGPWRFGWQRTCNDPAICGTSSTCQAYNTCATYSAGIAVSFKTEHPSTKYTYTCVDTCKGSGYTDCSNSCSGSEPGATCKSAATARRPGIVSTVPTSAPGYSVWLSTLGVNGRAGDVTTTETIKGGSFGKPLITTTKTSYDCDLDITNFPSPKVGPAAACGCGTFVPNTCVCETGITLTTASANAPVPTSAGPGRTFTSAPACLTCDDSNFGDSPADASTAFTCLSGNRPGATGQLDQSLAARLKLVMQLGAEGLTPAQRAEVEALYDQPAYDAAAPACQQPLAIEASCRDQAFSDGMNVARQLQLCADLRAAHVPAAAVRAEMSHCLSVLTATGGLNPGPCRDSLRDLGADVMETLIERAGTYDASDGLAPELVETLRQVDAWYGALALTSDDPAWLRGRASQIAGKIWRRAHEAAQPLPTSAGSDAAAAALLTDAAGQGLAVDWAMLRAAFDPSQPIDSPPLLYIVADALRGTVERLEQASAAHDVACRFAGCAPTSANGAPRATAMSQAWSAVSSVDDPSALDVALANAGALGAQHPDLLAALQAMRDQHAVLQRAWGDVTPSLPLKALVDAGTAMPIEAEALATVLRSSRAHAASYAASGRFIAGRPRLNAAVLKREQLVGFLDQTVGQLDGARQAYANARLDSVNDLLEQVRTEGETQSVVDRTVAAVFQTRELLSQLEGLRARERAERASLGEFMVAFESVVQSGAFDADAAYQIDTLQDLTVRPADAHHVPGNPLDLPAVRASVVRLEPGQLLDVDMLDTAWTPTCALAISQIASPAGAPAGIDVAGAITGPEGYTISWADSHYRAVGFNRSYTQSNSETESFEQCGGFSVNFPPSGISLPVIGSISASQRNCSTSTTGYTNSSSSTTTTGSDIRVSASFNAGVRLPITPLPFAPVGSLLAVLTVADQPAHILDVRVVNRRDSIQAPALDPAIGSHVDVHFVVNDVTGVNCPTPVDDPLRLKLRVITPSGLVAKAVGAAMTVTLEEIEAQAPSVLAQGGLTSGDAGALRTQAWARLTLQLAQQGRGLQGLPVELRNLYEAWLEKGIASLGRRGEIDRVQRDIARIGDDMLALDHELGNLQTRSRLLGLIPRWRLRDLAGVRLRPSFDALGEALSDYAAPVFELRDPARLSGFRQSANAQINALLGLDFAQPLDEIADDLRLFAVAARNGLAAAEFELPTNARRTVVLAFPRSPEACEGLCDEFKQAPASASERLWQGVEGPDHLGPMTVRPADLYAPSGGNASLACGDLAPVVRRAAIYALNPVNTSVDFGAIGRELPAAGGAGDATFDFPRAGSVLTFAAEAPTGVQLSLPVINGPGGDVLSDFGVGNGELGAGAGISPFTTFDVDFGSFYSSLPLNFLDDTQAILLVLEVERRLSAEPAFVPGACQNAVTP
ncbi:MAG: hypothetical protein MUF34_08695 [Polyangiaceae bacterium]|nr:hypothetical protein [Polyangiaceae bacterium]